MSSPQSGYIPTLDGWRAVAIAAVILSHSFPSNSWASNGALGVNLFFAISGFLITTRLADEESARGSIALTRFYLRRVFRIQPAALVYLAAIALLAASGVIYSSRIDLLSCLLSARNYLGSDARHGWYTGHFWSLAVEEQFYLFWPAVLAFAGSRRSRWIAPGLAMAFAVWRSLDLRHAWVANLLHNELMRNYPIRSDYRMDALLWGCALALFARKRGSGRPGRPLSGKIGSPLAVSVLAVVIALNVYQPRGYMLAQAVLMPLPLISTVSQSAGWLGRCLESPPLRWVGRLSYSLYLWQQLFFSQYHHGTLQRFPANLLCVLAAACGSYYFVEKPCIRWGRRLLAEPQIQGRQAPLPALAAAR